MASTSTATAQFCLSSHDDDDALLPHAATTPSDEPYKSSSTTSRTSPSSRRQNQHRPSHRAEAPSPSRPRASHSAVLTPDRYSTPLSLTGERSRRHIQGSAAAATPSTSSPGHAPQLAQSHQVQVQRESDARDAPAIANPTPSPRAPPTTLSRRHSTRTAAGTSHISHNSVDGNFAPVSLSTLPSSTAPRGDSSPTPSVASSTSSTSRRRRRPDARTSATPTAVDLAAAGQGRQEDQRERTSVEYEALQKRYNLNSTSPILPKVKLAFPLITSDEEDGWSPRPSIYAASLAASPAAAGTFSAASPERNYSSTTTTTTTTTTRRTEHRTWTYSMPPKLERRVVGLTEEDSGMPNPRQQRTSSSSSSARRQRAPSSASAPPPSPTLGAARNPVAATLKAPPSPTPIRFRSLAGQSGSRSSPSVRKASTTRRSSSLRNASTFTASASSSTFAKYGSRALTTSPHLAGSVLSALTFLLISAMACVAIGSVLVSSIALTFYDDCGKRIVDVRKSIEGSRRRLRGSIEDVRAGVGRVVGGARGAVELVVWATSARVASTFVLDNVELDLDYESFAEIQDGDTFSSSSSTTASEPAVTPEQRPSRRNSLPSTTSDSRPMRERQTSSTSSSVSGSWTEHEEDNLPFTVPFTTPHSSRSASPSRPERGETDQACPHLPPRPPLSILVPSIVFALAYTVWTVLSNFWRKPTSASEKLDP
ncbi:BQ2448_3193 [Microbotryum intermedium]|uniref:BQ2448_3193 protein n=1 Tax=Microbotryum intermedium TaxID=269621 RepID=A0A238FEI6_9BASI|nr:BQ2448_3193 [Microbotryum intermedium]